MRRRLVVTAVAAALGLLGACGGGSSGTSSSSDTPAPPGANVDPNATGYVGGSVNRAKAVGEKAEQRDAQLEQQGGAGQP